jgi:hypothetical protein
MLIAGFVTHIVETLVMLDRGTSGAAWIQALAGL